MTNVYRTQNCGELNIQKCLDEEFKLAGCIKEIRNLGGMTFIDLRDRYGKYTSNCCCLVKHIKGTNS